MRLTRPVPSRRNRLLVALGLGALAAMFLLARAGATSDFDLVWLGARALRAGHDPYVVVGPGRQFVWDYPFFYPLTAVIAVMPLSTLPLPIARAVWGAVGTALCVVAVTRDGWHRWPLFISAAFFVAVGTAQWTPYLTAAAVYPWLGAVLVAKPNVGAACWLALRGGHAKAVAAGLAAGLVAVSLAIAPTWPLAWRAELNTSDNLTAPLLRPGGILLALALLRWRRREAWFLLAFACAPSNPGVYEAVPTFLLTATLVEALVLAAGSSLVHVIVLAAFGPLPLPWHTAGPVSGALLVAFVYVPCLVFVLRRPNEGPAPAWLERALVRWRVPGWLAGSR